MRMKKRNDYLMAAALLSCSSMLFTGCAEHDNPAGSPVTVIEPTPEVQPTDDQMAVRVTHALPVAAMSQFGHGSTAAALIRRLATTTASIGNDTRLVLLQGSDYSENSPQLSLEAMTDVAEVYMLGGYVALERPTLQQLANFMESLVVCGEQLQRKDLLENFEIPEDKIAEATESSLRERMQARMANISSCATRADRSEADDVCAEMVIFDGDDCFYMEPLREENAAATYATDDEGRQTTETVVMKRTVERTEYMAGQMADAIAGWLNEQEAEREQQAQQSQARIMTRAGSTTAINELMDASDTFTFNGQVYWRSWDNQVLWDGNRLQMTIRAWGVHNMQNHRDYYMVKQDVTMKMGKSNKTTLFYTEGLDQENWWKPMNFPGYNCYYGSFFSKYTTSMELDGKGAINCIASKPEADNTTTTETVQLGNSSSSSTSYGSSFSSTVGFKLGFSGLSPTGEVSGSVTAGVSATAGYTNGSSFSISGAKTHKDISVKKNSSEGEQKVEWVYTGRLPKVEGNVTHEIVSDILVSDLTMHNEACWMVENPVDQYTLKIHSVPETAAILLNYDYGKKQHVSHRYENCVTIYNNDFSHKLIQPNRAEQTWRMNIIINETSFGYEPSAQRDLELYISKSFPDLYRNVFTVADKTPQSLQMANIIIKHAKQVFDSHKDVLQGIARNYNIDKFTITWRCDATDINVKEGYTVEVE